MSEIIKQAIEKLEKEANCVSGQNVPSIAIYNFIKAKCESEEEFSKQVLIETKQLSKCFSHIMEIAYTRAKAQHNTTGENKIGIGMSSDEIFALAVEYFNLDDAAIEAKKAEERKIAEAKRKEDDEKRKADQAKKAAEAKTNKKNTKPDKPKTEKSPEAIDKPLGAGQMTLFEI